MRGSAAVASVDGGDFWGYLGQRNARARYVVSESDPGPSGVAMRVWRDRELKERRFWLVDRRPQEPHR